MTLRLTETLIKSAQITCSKRKQNMCQKLIGDLCFTSNLLFGRDTDRCAVIATIRILCHPYRNNSNNNPKENTFDSKTSQLRLIDCP